MSAVMIRCPRTDRAVSTQIDTEASVFQRLPEVESRMQCPACGEEHVWSPSNAWLETVTLAPGETGEPPAVPAAAIPGKRSKASSRP